MRKPGLLTHIAPLCLGICAVCAQPAAAQTGAAEQPVAPRYNVEVIVFAHMDFDPGEERFAPLAESETPLAEDVDLPPPSPAILIAVEAFDRPSAGPLTRFEELPEAAPASLPDADAAAAEGMTTVAGDPLEFMDPLGTLGISAAGVETIEPEPGGGIRLLTSAELQLADARRIIDRLGAYRLLGHAGWQQDGKPQNEATPVDIAALGIPNPSGSLVLYLGRFLHFGVDLDYRLPAGSRNDPAAAPAPGAPGPGQTMLREIELPQRYRLTAERNAIRSGELHYIDHPVFGVLVLITPAPEEDPDGTIDAATSGPAA